MEKHFKILGYLYIAYGILTLAMILYVSIAPVAVRTQPMSEVLLSVAIFMSTLVGAFYIFTGWALLNRKEWARGVTIAASVLALFNFPLGTALGIYGLWAMFSSGAQEAFRTYTGTGGTSQMLM